MDNRRPTSDKSTNSPDRNNNYSRDNDRPAATRPYQPRSENSFQPRDNRFQPRNDRFQSRDDRQPSGSDRFQPRDDRPRNTGSGDRFQPRDNRNQSSGGGGRFQPRNDRPNPNDRSNQNEHPRYTDRPNQNARSDRSNQNDRFQPRGTFVPRGKSPKPWEKPPARVVSEMQITDGKHQGKYLQSTTADKVRPTARRIREAVFRILYRRIRAARFLDLCAGAGTVGIEAISRGAIISTFVERSAQMCSFIRKNLETMSIKEGHGDVHEIEVAPFLKRMAKRKRQWDIVYFDPPYDTNYEEVMDFFSRGAILRPGGLLLVEHSSAKEVPERFGVMSRWRVVAQGDTTVTFYEKKRD